eukprot:gnl/Spiro4/24971_TR12418_c0_g1_i1.p1 gnl/Spiro4/24971_TR12418_c0_g1~~gnl/Spiro4/24971_TR12418_c0_g1_i1.p1  ORF type:complete len:314 (-),score=62.64 gnl/Spiro4/24971_TR12418_c0_g1_i1:78-1019(-)
MDYLLSCTNYLLAPLEHPTVFVTSVVSWFSFHFFLTSVAPRIFPSFIKNLRTKLDEVGRETYSSVCTRVVAFVFTLTALVGASYVLLIAPQSVRNDFHAEFEPARAVCAWAIGYFLWDLVVCLYEGWGWGFLMHAVCCLFVYTGSQQNFMLWMGCSCLLYELSTPFLHAVAILRAVGHDSGSLFRLCSLLFTICFGGVRIVWAIPINIEFCKTLLSAVVSCSRGEACHPGYSAVLYVSYAVINCLLTVLNCFWFVGIVKGAVKILRSSSTSPKSASAVAAEAKCNLRERKRPGNPTPAPSPTESPQISPRARR